MRTHYLKTIGDVQPTIALATCLAFLGFDRGWLHTAGVFAALQVAAMLAAAWVCHRRSRRAFTVRLIAGGAGSHGGADSFGGAGSLGAGSRQRDVEPRRPDLRAVP